MTTSEGLRHEDVVAALEELATTQPDATALVDGEVGRRTTYGQLLARVGSAAAALRSAGVRPGDRVALVAESSPAYLVAVLALWRIRAVAVTIYASSGSSDLHYAVELADPVLLLADARADLSAVPLKEWGVPVVDVEDLAGLAGAGPLRAAAPTRPTWSTSSP